MKNDFIVAITQLAAEKNLPKDVVFEAVEAALASAYKKDNLATSNVVVKIDQETGITRVFTRRTVVEEVEDGEAEMTLDEAKKLKLDATLGDNFDTEVMPENAGRIAAQTAKQVVLQRLREAEREVVYEEYSGREGDIVSGEVVRMEGRNVIIDMGKAEALLPTAEQVRGEHYRPGQRVKCYVLEVYKAAKGPQVIVSRSNKHLIRRLFELEVPEIFKGIVEIKAIAREAGYRSKVSVWSTQDGIDPVGACVGLRALRIQNIVNELNGERIDVVLWDPEPSRFAAHALSPAQVIDTRIDVETNTAYVVVPDVQLSLAIGKEGQNARLAAKLTGMRIDIKSQTVHEEYLASLSPEELKALEEAAAEPAPAEAAPAEEAAAAEPAPAAVGEKVLTPEEEAVLATKEEALQPKRKQSLWPMRRRLMTPLRCRSRPPQPDRRRPTFASPKRFCPARATRNQCRVRVRRRVVLPLEKQRR
ncbi:MAG: transcription termination/antitermination protein NusA [Chloroflexi bacterium]|nr:transcription termination/antitermination protein NusA [Chloroflexota bacterium]